MMQKRILEYIRQQGMMCSGDRVIAGVSGGADSVCLLSALYECREELGISLRAVHVHHGIRGEEADRDAAFTEEYCGKLGIPCETVHRDIPLEARTRGMSEEEAGRRARYEILENRAMVWEEEAAEGDKPEGRTLIAVAHNAGDSAETILYNLFRGSGLKGIGGISPVRGNVVRPLLWASRKEILAYLEDKGISYCEDSSNQCNVYRRNIIRNSLIPMVEQEINENALEHILQAGRMASEADEYLEQEAKRIYRLAAGTSDGKDCLGLSIAELEGLPSILQTYVLRLAVSTAGRSLKDVAYCHIAGMQELITKPVGRQVDLPGGLRARRDYDILWIERAPEADGSNEVLEAKLPRIHMTRISNEKNQKIPENQYTKWFDYDNIKDTLFVRNRKTGDYITLPGGGKKTVKAYMIDQKIPRENRDRILLLAEGSHILWIIGYRISEYYKVTEETKNILQVRVDGGNGDGR